MKNTKQRTTFLGNRTAVPVRTFKGAAALITAALLALLITACPNSSGGGSTPQSKYAVTFGVDGANGTLSAKSDGIAETETSPISVEEGKTVTFTATPAEGYKVKSWTLDGTAVNGKNNTYSLNITKSAAVKVSFESNAVPLPKYAVTFGVDGANGTLTAKVDGAAINSGAQVEKGKTVTFTATPAEGYRVKGWTLDGTAVNGTAETYPLTVSKAAAVKVSFELIPPKYAVNFNVEGGSGTLTAKVEGTAINSGAQVEKGKTVTFTATPAAGYRIIGWSRNGSYLSVAGTGNTYSEPITSDITVDVGFELDVPNYTVNFGTEGGNGTLTALGPNSQPITTGTEIAKGKKVYFTAEPAPGYMTGSWTISGGTFEAGTGTPENPLANVTVSAPLTVKVSFKPADYIPLSKLDIEGTILKGYTGEKPAGILRVPAGITEIAETAFMECPGITEVHLPESLTKIGNYAFKDCEGITKLTMGKNLTHIAYGAFDSCRNLEGMLEFPPNLAEIGDYAFDLCYKVSGLDFSKCTQPLTIGDGAFKSCEITGTVKLPAKLTSLGKNAFRHCGEVENFDFRLCKNPPLTAIGTDAFYDTNGRFKVKTGTGIKELLTASGVPAGRIDEES